MFRFFSKSPKIFCTFQVNRFIHKYIFNMEKAYLRHVENGSQFELTLKFSNPELRVDRLFNFNRKLEENIDTFSSRVASNIEKIVKKKNKKKSDAGEVGINIDVMVLLNNSEVSKDKTCEEIFQADNDIVLKIMGKEYKVIVNSPWVDKLSLPISILAGFPTYPTKFETVFTDKLLSQFTWSKSVDEKNWTIVGNDYIYQPQNEDINNYLKLTCIPKNEKFEGPVVECVSICRVEANPGKCPFETRHLFTQKRTKENELRIVTYNILADLYCDSDYTRTELHPYCPPYALEIDYRKQLFIKEIIGYNSDIICLQEVDRKVFEYDLNSVLSHLGYGSNFFTKGNEVAEGLALFYYKKKFSLVESHRFVFSEHISKDPIFSDIWEQIAKNENLAKRILDRSTTMQVNVLDVSNREEMLVVANTHLYFHPDADHIRLLHGGLAIRYLEHFINNLKEKTSKRVSLIFCGDFNSVPECGIFKLYTEGEVPKNFIDYHSNKDEVVTEVELKQPFVLASACGTPNYTNYTAQFQGCLDYIFYEKTNFEVTQVVPLPSHEEVTANTALPSFVFPSDHIALISDLKWL
ncbi:2',5'-phosphodiesterase 12 isoform X1 [Diorhabda sublineata]|uniref:2',5'-phosphodiesterase 12 isoform X1 n=1 Tax=Diorhabda sublineata TaxID=1163346 RepID=UPI0024E161D8|nr:2',5'-phosphodiesterase 12 isoform X1 [Diorhabda sublineata]